MPWWRSLIPDWGSTALDPDGRLLAVRSGGEVVLRYDPATGQALEAPASRFVLGKRLLAAAAHPETGQLDGDMLASAASDSTLRLWRMSDGSLLHILTGHEDQVGCVAFSPDGTLLASGALDYTLRLWGVVRSVTE